MNESYGLVFQKRQRRLDPKEVLVSPEIRLAEKPVAGQSPPTFLFLNIHLSKNSEPLSEPRRPPSEDRIWPTKNRHSRDRRGPTL